MNTIELTDKEAELFLVFREHQEMFKVLIDKKVHKMSNGNAILSFNSQGQLAQVRFEQIVYRR